MLIGALAERTDTVPVAVTLVGKLSGADLGTVIVWVNLPSELAFADPTISTCSRISTRSDGLKQVPYTVTFWPRRASPVESVIAAAGPLHEGAWSSPPPSSGGESVKIFGKILILPSSLSATSVPGSARHSPRTPITTPTVVPVLPDTSASIPARKTPAQSERQQRHTGLRSPGVRRDHRPGGRTGSAAVDRGPRPGTRPRRGADRRPCQRGQPGGSATASGPLPTAPRWPGVAGAGMLRPDRRPRRRRARLVGR